MADAVVIEGSDLPDSVRLQIFVSFLSRLMREDPAAASQYGPDLGVDGDSSAFLLLAELYGDFDYRQMETFSEGMPGLDYEERRLFSRSLADENERFLGSTTGQWFKALESAGQDPTTVVRWVLEGSSFQASVGFSGEPVTPQDLEERALRFEIAFEEAFGEPLANLIGASE